MTSSIYLLDANVLIALSDLNHSLHERADAWFRPETRFATCPITQAALLRYYLRLSATPAISAAKDLLASFIAMPLHTFWADDVSCISLPEKGVTGHRQVTDAYLVALARRHHGILATMDEAVAAIHDGVLLI
jgi:toxin-antitoxin system PIN domain toxin